MAEGGSKERRGRRMKKQRYRKEEESEGLRSTGSKKNQWITEQN